MPSIRRIYTSIVYLEGTSLQGIADEVKLPEIEFEVDEGKRLGLFGIAPAISGIQKMKTTVTFSAWDTIWATVAANMRKRVSLQFRGSLEDVSTGVASDPVSYIVTIGGIAHKFPLGNFKPQDAGKWEAEFATDYVRQVVNGVEILKYSARTNEYAVNGVDQLQSTRSVLGL